MIVQSVKKKLKFMSKYNRHCDPAKMREKQSPSLEMLLNTLRDCLPAGQAGFVIPIKKSGFLAMTVAFLLSFSTSAQDKKIIDQIVATVGNRIILLSDVEAQYQQYLLQGNYKNETVKCQALDKLMLQKLLLHQGILDSVEVTDNQVESELSRRLEYFVSQLGSEEKLEEYYKKSVEEIRDEFRPLVKDQLTVQSMQSKVTSSVTVSPAEVKTFYESIPKDSLPFINAEIEYMQIVKKVPVSAEEKEAVRIRLEEIRQRIIKGEDFGTLAFLYSKDPGSAKNNGELGFVRRGDFVPEFEAAAFRLKPGELSGIVESKFGFHIIQLIERRGEQINVRHILLKPEIKDDDVRNVISQLDSLAKAIRNDSVSFAKAAEKFSDDLETRYNSGLVVNQKTNNSRFETDQVDPTVFFTLDKLETAQVSDPTAMQCDDGMTAFRILMLKSRTQPHQANLKEDYQRLRELALSNRQSAALQDWVIRKKKSTYIHIDASFNQCSMLDYWRNNP